MRHTPIYKNIKERFLFLYITEKCNLRCKHCYVGNKRLNRARFYKVSEIKNILDYFKTVGGHDKLYLIGGEPTLHPSLKEIIDLGYNKGFSVTLSTHGLFVESLFDKISPKKLASLNISLESCDPKIHNKIRGTTFYQYNQIIKNIKTAVNKKYQVRIMCTVCETNYKTALKMIDYVERLGAHTLSFHNLGLTGNAGKQLKPLSPTKWMKFCEQIEAHKPTSSLAVYYPPTFINKSDLKKYFNRGYPGCPARTFDRPHIFPDNRVYLCPLFMDYKNNFATFKKNRLVFNLTKNSETNVIFNIDSQCLDCTLKEKCGGGCPAYSFIRRYFGFYRCDKNIVPLCILWTTYAWNKKPKSKIHEFR